MIRSLTIGLVIIGLIGCGEEDPTSQGGTITVIPGNLTSTPFESPMVPQREVVPPSPEVMETTETLNLEPNLEAPIRRSDGCEYWRDNGRWVLVNPHECSSTKPQAAEEVVPKDKLEARPDKTHVAVVSPIDTDHGQGWVKPQGTRNVRVSPPVRSVLEVDQCSKKSGRDTPTQGAPVHPNYWRNLIMNTQVIIWWMYEDQLTKTIAQPGNVPPEILPNSGWIFIQLSEEKFCGWLHTTESSPQNIRNVKYKGKLLTEHLPSGVFVRPENLR